jgi:GNAT superfamily N-acetyltransferase
MPKGGTSLKKTVAWIGMMLVDRDYRGRGISKLLLLDAIGKLNGLSLQIFRK